jgi:hypothetical protein
MVSLRIQEDLRSLPLERAPWYVAVPLVPEANDLLGAFARLELQKENPTGDQTQLRHDLAGLRVAAWRIVKPKLGQVFAVVMSSPEQKSRIRSHKGLFWETPVKRDDFRQREIDLGEQSYFLGIVKVDPANSEWAFGKALRRFHAFLYVASERDIDVVAKKLFPLLPEFINRDVIPYFELPRVVPALVESDQAIFHLDSDASAERWSELSIYTKTANVPYWKQAVNAQIEDAESTKLFESSAGEERATCGPDGASNYGRVYWPGK